MLPERKPPVRMESREARSLHFTPSEWEAIADGARLRGLAPSVFARMLAIYGLSIVQAPAPMEAALAVPRQNLGAPPAALAGSRGTRRF